MRKRNILYGIIGLFVLMMLIGSQMPEPATTNTKSTPTSQAPVMLSQTEKDNITKGTLDYENVDMEKMFGIYQVGFSGNDMVLTITPTSKNIAVEQVSHENCHEKPTI